MVVLQPPSKHPTVIRRSNDPNALPNSMPGSATRCHCSRLHHTSPSSAALLQAPPHYPELRNTSPSSAEWEEGLALLCGRSNWRRAEEAGGAAEREDVLAPWSWRSVAGKELAVPEVVVLKLLVLCLYAGAGRMSYTLNRGEARLGNYRSHFGVGSTMHVRRW